MINGKPETRLELLDNLNERFEITKEAGSELMLVELWEMAWLLKPELARLAIEDANGTAQLQRVDLPTAAAKRVNVRIVGPEDYIEGLDCNGATEPYKKVGD